MTEIGPDAQPHFIQPMPLIPDYPYGQLAVNAVEVFEMRWAGNHSGADALTRTSEMLHERAMQGVEIDLVTGLETRKRFKEVMGRAIARQDAEREATGSFQHNLAILYLDVDGLKRANEEVSHLFGDEVLAKTASALVAVTRSLDKHFRIGDRADEMGAIMHWAFTEQPDEVVDQLEGTMQRRLSRGLNGRLLHPSAELPPELYIGASLGVVIRRPGETMEEMMERAEAKMKADKKQRREDLKAEGVVFSEVDDRLIISSPYRPAPDPEQT